MNLDVAALTEIIKQIIGVFLAMFQVSTSTGQGLLKIVDLFGLILEMFVKLFARISGLFGGLFGLLG